MWQATHVVPMARFAGTPRFGIRLGGGGSWDGGRGDGGADGETAATGGGGGAEGGGPGWLEHEIQRGYAQVRDAAREDTAKPHSNDAFEAEVERLLEFARERSAVVREQVRRSPR